MRTLQERLKHVMAGPPKISQAALARACGITPPSVNDWLSGKTKSIEGENLLRAAALLGISPMWLATGRGAMRPSDQPVPQRMDSNVQGDPQQVKEGRVPVVGKAMLGPDGYFEAMEYPVGHGEGYLNIFSTDENAYGLRVAGHSMKPRIKHNEFVLIEPSKDYVAGDEVLVKTVSGQAMIKEFVYFRDGQYRFDSVNNAFDPIYLTQEEIVFIHYMGAIVKSSRFVEAD